MTRSSRTGHLNDLDAELTIDEREPLVLLRRLADDRPRPFAHSPRNLGSP